jgi:hypothetical protein
VIDTAATCVQNSLGFTFLHQSKEKLPDPDDEKLPAATQLAKEAAAKEADEDEVFLALFE